MTLPTESAGVGIVPRAQHPVSRKQISGNALRVLYRLHDAGYQAYLVGGAVRDLLLGLAPKDFDVATDARPEQIRQLFRNCRLIGRRFRLAHIHFGRDIIEVATFRGTDDGEGDRELDNGRLLRDNVYGTLEEDIFRRDFTANALYYNIGDFSVLDRVGGIADIQARHLRLIGEPSERFREDPVRMMRAVRFAAKLDFRIDQQLLDLMPSMAPLLVDMPPARLFDETGKMLLNGHALRSFDLLRECGLLAELMPQVQRSLQGEAGGRSLEFIRTALADADQRLAQGKTLTTGFILAVLLWQPATQLHQQLVAAGEEPSQAWLQVGERVIVPFCRRVAVPRRITLGTLEIWTMQHWLVQRQRRRVVRLLGHPRFRAAFDFLSLRAGVEPELAPLAQWWQQAQTLEPAQLREQVQALGQAGSGGPDGADGADARPSGRRRRRSGRRRRRGGKGNAAPEG